MIPIQLRVTTETLERIDYIIDQGLYTSRSDFIRDAVRSKLLAVYAPNTYDED